MLLSLLLISLATTPSWRYLFKMLSFATSHSKATGASRLLTVLFAALLCLLLGAASEANAQQLTTFTDTE